MELKGLVPQRPVRWSPVSVMHTILKWATTGSLAGTNAIAVQQWWEIKAWQDN